MTIIEDRAQAVLDGEVTLDEGNHATFEAGHCALEVVAWLTDEAHSDAPECVSLVLRRFVIDLNDAWDEVQRQRLVPFLLRLVGTAGDGQDEARKYLAVDWLVRTYTPTWLECAGLGDEAQKLRDLRQIVDEDTAQDVAPVVSAASEAADAAQDAAWVAAWVAAWSAAGSAAWAAAWDAAWVAARDAAWFAARDAARSAAGDAAQDAAGSAARDAAGAAARAAVGSAARSAAGSAAGSAARDAAQAAARDALRPTVEALQASALELLDRMIDPASIERGVAA